MFWFAEFVLLWVVIGVVAIVAFLTGESVGFADGYEEGIEFGTAEGYEMSEREASEDWYIEYVGEKPVLRVPDSIYTDNLFDAL